MRGKPWPFDDEKRLKDWFTSGTKDLRVLSFSFDGRYSENAVYQKLLDLGLLREEEEERKKQTSSSFKLELPKELPSIEETLITLSGALKALDNSLLEKTDIFRLKCIISGAKVYKELLADYINYRGLEAELLELREKYAELSKKTQGFSPK
jgi:hypothetical protein